MGKYVYNSSLPFVRANFNGNRIIGKRFTNYPYPDPDPNFKKILKWKLARNPQKKEKKRDSFKLEVQFLTRLPDEPSDCIIWLGHASFFIRLNGVSILTDPLLGKLPFLPRKAPLPIAIEALTGIDYILISHAHRDHYDQKSLNKLLKNNPGAEVLGPLRLKGLLSNLRALPLHQEAGWYQQFELKKPIDIVFLPAVHWHRRGLFDLNEILWGSFYISHGDKNVFFAGDSAYNKHFKNIGEMIGPMQVSLLPIAAYKPEYLMQRSHLNPEEAVMAANHLESQVMIPMHYGTLDLSDEPLGEPIRWLQDLEKQNALDGQLKILQPGEIYHF